MIERAQHHVGGCGGGVAVAVIVPPPPPPAMARVLLLVYCGTGVLLAAGHAVQISSQTETENR